MDLGGLDQPAHSIAVWHAVAHPAPVRERTFHPPLQSAERVEVHSIVLDPVLDNVSNHRAGRFSAGRHTQDYRDFRQFETELFRAAYEVESP
jgi:hypothetical protein